MEKQPFGRRPTTLRDIAVRAGASVSTVSRALRGDQRISARTRQRIVEIAQRLGYRADVAGSLLRASKPRVVGLLCDLSQELHVAYRHEILQRVEQAGFRVVVESVEGRCPPGAALRRLREFRIQALVVVDPRCLGGAGDPGAPVVVIGQERPFADADLVTSDNGAGMGEAVEWLAGLGHRGITYVDGPPGASARARRAAAVAAARGAGAPLRVVPGGADLDSGFLAARSMVDEAGAGRPLPSAVMCYNDQCAHGLIIALLRAGLVPGRDVSVIGFDNSRIAATRALSIASVDRRPAEVARHAVDLARARALGDEPPPRAVRVDTALVRRGSVGPPPAPGAQS